MTEGVIAPYVVPLLFALVTLLLNAIVAETLQISRDRWNPELERLALPVISDSQPPPMADTEGSSPLPASDIIFTVGLLHKGPHPTGQPKR